MKFPWLSFLGLTGPLSSQPSGIGLFASQCLRNVHAAGSHLLGRGGGAAGGGSVMCCATPSYRKKVRRLR